MIKIKILVGAALIGFVLLVLAPAGALAMTNQDFPLTSDTPTTATQAAASGDAPTLPGMMGRLTLSLGVVFALMAGVFWGARRYLPKGIQNTRGGNGIEILASRGLGRQKSLLLVRARDKTLLLGVTAQAIQCLAEVDQEPAVWADETLNALAQEPAPRKHNPVERD